ncbi:collagen alpha-6(VI) chain [Elysia marginata]|uniref:Collagen alpha-6(VI) chain n=1 Tax=Elysia marginata TaxID=1093978 RepID=A0AAV4H9F1_9GAST|nr:collagen alpha-6(VI) chain [Elysia marginata]
MVDVVFALDSSTEITPRDFWYQVNFVRDFALGLDLGTNGSRIGVLLYGSRIIPQFDINAHSNLYTAISALNKVRLDPTAGVTRLDKVLRHVTTKSFRRSVARRNAAQMVILVTGSASSNLNRVKKESRRARKTGVDVVTIGVGDDVNPEELSIISGDEKPGFFNILHNFKSKYSGKRDTQKLFRIPTFDELRSVVQEIAIQACTAEQSPVPVSDQACGTRQEADMMFVMDSASAGKKNTKKTLDFMKKVANKVEVGKRRVQMGLIHPDECDTMTESFRLDSHRSRDQIMSSLDRKEGDEISRLLRDMRKDGFKKKKGGRWDAKKIAVVLIDGVLEKPMRALKEARDTAYPAGDRRNVCLPSLRPSLQSSQL